MNSFKLEVFRHLRPVLLAGVLLLPFGMAAPCCANAQWSIAASKVIGQLPVEGSAITYNDGVVWAGFLNLLRSNDSGVTWKSIPQFFDPTLDRILDIQFLDTNNGLVTTYFGAYV